MPKGQAIYSCEVTWVGSSIAHFEAHPVVSGKTKKQFTYHGKVELSKFPKGEPVAMGTQFTAVYNWVFSGNSIIDREEETLEITLGNFN